MVNPSPPKPGFPPGGTPAAPSTGVPRTVPGVSPAARTGTPAASQPPAADPTPGGRTGKVVHDSRGNAVWDWVKHTGRHAIDSTSRLLKKLETPELKIEQTHDEELRIVPDAGAGGGGDPYNQKTKPKRPGGK